MSDRANGGDEVVEHSLESTLESVDRGEALAVGAAERAGFDEDDQLKIGMAVRESMVNAVVHGNRYNSHKQVRLVLRNNRERLTIQICDEGEGFDVSSLPDPLAPENLLRTSGRGIFLMRSFMDEVDIRRRQPAGMEVTLVKYVVSK